MDGIVMWPDWPLDYRTWGSSTNSPEAPYQGQAASSHVTQASPQLGDRAMWAFFGDENRFTTSAIPWLRQVFLLAGYAVDQTRLPALLRDIENVKKPFGLSLRHPVKYNFKDDRLRSYYHERGEDALLAAAQPKSEPIRRGLLQLLQRHQARTFVCAMGSLGFKSPKEYYGWTTTNLLQRLGYLCQGNAALPDLLVCLDWPDSNVGKSYFANYHEPWHTGKSVEGHTFTCGSLRSRQAFPDLVVGSTIHNPFLQLADLVAGAAQDFVTWAITGNGLQRTSTYFPPVALCFLARPSLRYHQTSFISAPDGLAGQMRKAYTTLATQLSQGNPPLILPV